MADLITLDEYKDYEGLVSTKDDTKLELLVSSVNQLVKTYCGNSIIDYYFTPKIEEFTVQWNENFVQLTESPVVNVSSVEVRDNEIQAYTTLSSTEYYVDHDTDTVFRINRNWPKGFGAVKITYTAGYSSTPTDLKLALVDLVRYYAKNEYKDRQTLSGATIENPSSASSRTSVAFPDHIKRVLDLYKNL